MTRTKPAEQRRADLLAAGQAQFLANGVAATSLEDITTRAGVSKGLFYLYFKSKEDLVLALQDQFSSEFAERILAAADSEPDWGAKLDACVQASFDFYRDMYDLHEVLFHHASHLVRHQEETGHGLVVRALQRILAEGTAAGAFDVEDPETTAVLCYASMHAFDPGFQGGHEANPADPDGLAILRAAQTLFRRVAGAGQTGQNRRSNPARAQLSRARSALSRAKSAPGTLARPADVHRCHTRTTSLDRSTFIR
jgi:TetR/AcrR family transcriptional regulator, transcriptional repressor for nem operon